MSSACAPSDPNFPQDLAISPLETPPALAPDADGPTYSFSPDVVSAADQARAIHQYGIAGRVWEASYALIAYAHADDGIWEMDPPFVSLTAQQITMVELGSGTGLVSLEIARQLEVSGRRATFVQTDLPEVCKLLSQTTQHYRSASSSSTQTDVIVHPLAWGDTSHASAIQSLLSEPPTHLICCDLVYFPELLAPLLRSLLHLTQTNDPTLIMAYKPRSAAKETSFWSALGLWFAYAPVRVRRRASDVGDDSWALLGAAWDEPMFVFTGRRRPESRDWTVPESDRDLLDGVGAQGTASRKGDDTFEVILLMSQSL